MKNIPITESPVIIRTDFSNQPVWKKIVGRMKKPVDPFVFNMEFLDDGAYGGASVEELIAALPKEYPHSFMVVVDRVAISQPDHPVLIVDLLEERGREFRALPSQIPSIENNLSIANMSFEEFAGAVDDSGVFRGFPEL